MAMVGALVMDDREKNPLTLVSEIKDEVCL
jgi:hypothetical protein